MTGRDQVRRSGSTDRVGASRSTGLSTADDSLPPLPERLRAGRERKGVDLYRAERDTKIRARYLAALERGDDRDLPGPVYTKGFLRNYALYLGLDPEDVLLQWRRERGGGREPSTVIAAPRPIAARRAGFTVSPALLVFALLGLAVLAFGLYLGVQLLRFAKPPSLAVTDPAVAVIEVPPTRTDYLLQGTSIAGATITIATPGREPYSVSADGTGHWRAPVDLHRGRNQFEVRALDPATGKRSDSAVALFISVPFQASVAPIVTLDQPTDSATVEEGAVVVRGHVSEGTSVIVRATYLGVAPGSSPAPSGSGSASAAVPPDPAAVTVSVAQDGSFATTLQLSVGRWALHVEATSSGTDGTSTAITRNVAVAAGEITASVTVKGGRTWLKVWVDGRIAAVTSATGKVVPAGTVVSAGTVLTVRAQRSMEVRTGNGALTYVSLNGGSVVRLATKPGPGTWLLTPGSAPVRTDRR